MRFSFRQVKTRSLFVQLLLAVVAGVLVGHFFKAFGADLKPIGDGFIKLIKMVIAPLIFCVVATGIAKVGDLRAVGRIGVKALIYFEVVSTAALAFGLLVGNVVRPGADMNVDPSTLDASAVEAKTQGGHLPGAVGFLLDLIPSSVVDALARNALLQVLLFAVLFGCALAQLGDRVTPVVDLLERINLAFFTVLGYVMKLAPLGAFGAVAFLVGQYGLGSLRTYLWLILASYGAAGVRDEPARALGVHREHAEPGFVAAVEAHLVGETFAVQRPTLAEHADRRLAAEKWLVP